MSELCLTLLCPCSIEENLLDALLVLPEITLFTSTQSAVHGMTPGNLSMSEQVLGCALATQVQVLMKFEDREAVLASIRSQFAGIGLRYWITPIIETGEVT